MPGFTIIRAETYLRVWCVYRQSAAGKLTNCTRRSAEPLSGLQPYKQARKAYLSFRSPYPIWEAHYHYIDALVSSGSLILHEEALARIANFIEWHDGLNGRILPSLWALIPQYLPSGQARSKLLHNLRIKVSKHRYRLPYFQRDTTVNQEIHAEATPAFEGSGLIQPADAFSLRDAFTAMLFSHESAASRRALSSELHDWALAETQAVFRAHSGFDRADTSQDGSAWHNLNLLSLTYNTNRSTPSDMQNISLGPPESGAEVVDWVLVCAIVAAQNLLSRRADLLPDTSVDHAQALVRTIWVLWRRDSGKRIRPASALCCAAVSFMRLATLTEDNTLRDSIVRYIGDAIVVPIILKEMVCDPESWRSLSVGFACMSAMFGVHNFLEMFDTLRANRLELSHDSSDGWRNVVANSVVKNLLQYNAGVALRLYHSSEEAEVEIREPILVELCKTSISSGYLLQALKILRLPNLTHSSRKMLLNTLLDHLASAGQIFDSKLARTVSNTFNNLVQSNVYPSKAQSCELVTLSMVKAGFAPEATSIVINIGKSRPDFLRAGFLPHFGRKLMFGRHYGCMKQLVRSDLPVQPLSSSFDRKHNLKRSGLPLHTVLAQIQERSPPFPELASNDTAKSRPNALLLRKRRRRRVFTRRASRQTRTPPKPRKNVSADIITLKLMNSVSKTAKIDPKSLERVLYILIRSGRFLAAQKILNRIGVSGFTTKAGNIMMTGSFVPRRSLRNKRQVQHIMRRLTSLIGERGFVPDRVTLNLLIMARLRWDSVTNKEAARILFDRLICAGYPDGSGLQPRDGPFQTEQTASVPKPEDIGTPRQILMSYSRHIRPLYKIFIKAFIDRGDYEAARTVKTILENVRKEMSAEAGRREQARMMGQIKAHERRAEMVKQNQRVRRMRWRSKRRTRDASDALGSAGSD